MDLVPDENALIVLSFPRHLDIKGIEVESEHDLGVIAYPTNDYHTGPLQ